MNLIMFEMPHISQTAILHTYIINTACSVRQDRHSGARKMFVSARIGQLLKGLLRLQISETETRPRHLNM